MTHDIKEIIEQVATGDDMESLVRMLVFVRDRVEPVDPFGAHLVNMAAVHLSSSERPLPPPRATN